MVSRVIPVDPFDLIIFGGTGDLARRKILPGLFRRFCAGQMPNNARIIGAARSALSAEQYKAQIKTAISEFGNVTGNQAKQLNAFLTQLDYVKIDVKGEEGWSNLASKVRKNFVNAHYFSVAPSLFGDIAKRLNDWKIATPDSRIVV